MSKSNLHGAVYEDLLIPTEAELRALGAATMESYIRAGNGWTQWGISKRISRIDRELLRRAGGRQVTAPPHCAKCGDGTMVADVFGTPDDSMRAAARPGLAFIDKDKWVRGTTFICRGCGHAADGVPFTTVWRLRAWDDPMLQQRWLNGRVVTMSEDLVGDMGDEPYREVIESRLRDSYPEAKGATIAIWTRYWVSFLKMAVDDLVVVPLANREVAFAEVRGPYEYKTNLRDRRLRHRRPVSWLVETMTRADLPPEILRTVNSPGTICRVKADGAEAWLRALDDRWES